MVDDYIPKINEYVRVFARAKKVKKTMVTEHEHFCSPCRVVKIEGKKKNYVASKVIIVAKTRNNGIVCFALNYYKFTPM